MLNSTHPLRRRRDTQSRTAARLGHLIHPRTIGNTLHPQSSTGPIQEHAPGGMGGCRFQGPRRSSMRLVPGSDVLNMNPEDY